MSLFTYKALKKGGEAYEGTLEAVDKFAVKNSVEENGDQIIFIEALQLKFIQNGHN